MSRKLYLQFGSNLSLLFSLTQTGVKSQTHLYFVFLTVFLKLLNVTMTLYFVTTGFNGSQLAKMKKCIPYMSLP